MYCGKISYLKSPYQKRKKQRGRKQQTITTKREDRLQQIIFMNINISFHDNKYFFHEKKLGKLIGFIFN